MPRIQLGCSRCENAQNSDMQIRRPGNLSGWITGLVVAVALVICQSSPSAAFSANWPQFRGSDSLGVSDNPRLADHWSTNKNVAWTIEVPGRGWSSPIVWGNRIFITTVVKEGEMEPP